MNLVQRVEHWGVLHHPRWTDFLRIGLGIFLCYKGVQFAENITQVTNLMADSIPFSGFMLIILGHYVVFAHILGGFMLALGMLTRVACIIQIPILIGAIVLINISPAVWQPFSQIVISVIVLLLLFYFLIVGSGPLSFDTSLNRQK
jgi:putative oxidoreductase